jgi:uncharacterized protein YgfB (UPF0149 family)
MMMSRKDWVHQFLIGLGITTVAVAAVTTKSSA